MTLYFAELSVAISAALSMIALLDTLPERISASSLRMTRMSSPGNRVLSCCSRPSTPASTTTSYWTRVPAPQTIRLTVPGALPSMRISRGWTTTASAIAGFVIAMRVTSNSVVRIVERPAGQRDLRVLGRQQRAPAAAARGALDGVPAGCCAARAPRRPAGRPSRSSRTHVLPENSTDLLFRALGRADGLDGVDLRRRRRRRVSGAARATARPPTIFLTGGGLALSQAAQKTRAPSVSPGATSSGLRSVSMMRALPRPPASASRRPRGVSSSVTTLVLIGLPSLVAFSWS